MSESTDYQRAYERQKKARERAENLLEVRSRELFEANQVLKSAYDSLSKQKNQLVQKEKLASIGLLAAGIAHEINNPIGFIKSNLQTLEEYLDLLNNLLVSFQEVAIRVEREPEQVDYPRELQKLVRLARDNDLAFLIKDSLDSIRESLAGTRRVEEIIINLRDFSRSDSDKRIQCDLNEVIENTLKLVWNEIKYKVKIHKELSELPLIYACVGQLNQVFINIILNAIQAMGDGGELTIGTKFSGHHVQVDFIDNGPGIPQDILNRLFDPFFTTKDVGYGTGLGLYISHGLIEQHQGSISVRNIPGAGACFSVHLPIDIRQSERG